MAICVCGYTHAHLQHVCWAPPPVPGTRVEPGPRCKCGTLHPHIQHDCSSFPEPAAAAVTFVAEPETKELAIAQFAAGWRPPNMCPVCPALGKPCLACYVRAGYTAESYARFRKEALP